MKEVLINPIIHGVITSLISTGLIALIGFFRLKYLKTKYDYILGDWNCYYLSRDENFILEIKILIKAKLGKRLSIVMEEKSNPNYVESGKIELIENYIFGTLKGKTHTGKGFLMLKLPFNRKGKIPALNGIYSGINQDEYPFSTKIHFSRFPIDINTLKKEFGRQKKYIISDTEATKNINRKTIMNSKTHTKLSHKNTTQNLRPNSRGD